jgi:predicted hydrocarbon binding protein
MTPEHREPTKWLFTNALMRQALEAVGEVMGERGLRIVLLQAGLERYADELPPDNVELGVKAAEYSALNAAIQEFYGRAGRGMLERIGRVSFRYGVEEQAALMGLAGVALKVMPEKTRVKFILSQMAKALMEVNEESVLEVEETPEGFVFVDHYCAICYGRQADEPVCHLLDGSLKEAVKWATGKEYSVREIECRAMGGSACRHLVEAATAGETGE